MQLIIAVLLVRFIISLVEKDKIEQANQSKISNRVVHPAEFEIR